MELFLLEHKKLWSKMTTKISVLLCFIYVVIFGSILLFQWFGFGSSDDYTSAFGNNFDGYKMIRDSQEYSKTFGGKLTDESLQKMVRDYQQMESSGTDTKMALFLAIILSSLFAGEWHNNTSSLVLTTKNGWKKIARAKIVTGLVFAVEFFAILTIGNIVSQVFFLRTSGWDMPVQLIKLISIAPMNMLQAELYEYAFTFLGAIGFAGVVMFISAKIRSNVLALLFSLAVVYVPMMIVEYLPYGVQKALDLIPLVGSASDIFRTNTFHILGKYIWSPYLLITVPVLIGILCMPLAVKVWSRRLKV